MRPCPRDGGPDRPGPGGGRGGVPPARRAVRAGTAGALLPDARFGAGRRGRYAGRAAGRLAGHRRLRGARLGPDLAIPGHHQPLPERAPFGPPAPGDDAAGPHAARADPARRGDLARALSGRPPEGLPAAEPGPEASYEAREAISLAFITAVQRLPPRQRAVLILRDVLGFAASEAARILGSTEESVTSALKRARATLRTRRPEPAPNHPRRRNPPGRNSSSSGSPAPTRPATWTASSPCSPTTPG